MSEKNQKFSSEVRRVLNESLEEFDGTTLSRLKRCRRQALEARRGRKPGLLFWGRLPVAGLVLLIFLLWRPEAPIPQLADPDLSVFNLMTDMESLDFYQEDIEFYEWLNEVLENENTYFDSELSQPADVAAALVPGAGGSEIESAASRIDRVYRHIL